MSSILIVEDDDRQRPLYDRLIMGLWVGLAFFAAFSIYALVSE